LPFTFYATTTTTVKGGVGGTAGVGGNGHGHGNSSNGNGNSGGVSYSSSELHLDRVSSMAFSCARPTPSTPQWVLGGSEVNLTSLARYV